MRVLLVQPKDVQRGFTRHDTRLPPLGLLCIAAAIRDIVEVRVIDADATGLDDPQVAAHVGGWIPDLVGMTLSCLTLPVVRRFAQFARETWRAKVIVGGALACAAPDLALQNPEFDMAGIGDGESVMMGLCDRVSAGTHPDGVVGLVCRTAHGISGDTRPARLASLAWPVSPAWDLVPDFGCYSSPDAVYAPVCIVEAQRGCPNSCTFCSVPTISGAYTRARPVHNVLSELEYLSGARKVREISFVDPDFMVDEAYARQLCAGLDSLGRPTSWFCNARVDSVTPQLASVMHDAGCHLVYLGLESGDPETLLRINKSVSPESMRAAARTLQKCGIRVAAGFIIGFPFDTDASVRRTIDFAKTLGADSTQFSLFNWFPGIGIGVSGCSSPSGFHPRGESSRWGEWQRRAYAELGEAT